MSCVGSGRERRCPTTAFLTPIECLVLDLFGRRSSRKWRYRAPRFSFVGSSCVVWSPVSRDILATVFILFRTLVGPMTWFATVVTIALLRRVLATEIGSDLELQLA